VILGSKAGSSFYCFNSNHIYNTQCNCVHVTNFVLFHLFELRNIRPIFLPVLYKRKVDIVRRTHKIEENKPSKEMINGNKSYCILTQIEGVPNGSGRVLSVFHMRRFERF